MTFLRLSQWFFFTSESACHAISLVILTGNKSQGFLSAEAEEGDNEKGEMENERMNEIILSVFLFFRLLFSCLICFIFEYMRRTTNRVCKILLPSTSRLVAVGSLVWWIIHWWYCICDHQVINWWCNMKFFFALVFLFLFLILFIVFYYF